MPRLTPATNFAQPPDHQLALPLEFPPTATPPPALLLDPQRPAPVERVWASLTPATQLLIRQTVLRVLQEVVHDVQPQ